MNIRTAMLTASLALGVISTQAQAGSTRISTEVDYSDLDLTSAEGVEALEQRLQKATRTMCGSYERRDGQGERPYRECIRAARIEPQLMAIVAEARRNASRQEVAVAAR